MDSCFTEPNPAQSRSTASHVLGLPELVSQIISHVWEAYYHDNDLSIFTCTLVNSLWATEATKAIWQICEETCGDLGHDQGPPSRPYKQRTHGPPVSKLAGMSERQQQSYANHIRILSFCRQRCVERLWPEEVIYNLNALAYPQLRIVVLHYPSFVRDHWQLDQQGSRKRPHLPYFQVRLKKLVLQDVPSDGGLSLSEAFVSDLQEYCTELKSLHMGLAYVRSGWTSSLDFISFLRSLPMLNELELTGLFFSSPNAQFGDVLKAISLLPNLERLELTGPTSEMQVEWIENLQEDLRTPPFQNLQRLHISIHGDSLVQLLSYIPNIRSLILQVTIHYPDQTNLFSTLCTTQLRNLETFEFRINSFNYPMTRRDPKICISDLISFVKGSPNLKELELSSELPTSPIACPSLNDFAFDNLVQWLPNIRKLKLLITCHSLTNDSLISVRKYCPFMQELWYPAYIDCATLIFPSPLSTWPHLRELHTARPATENSVPIDEPSVQQLAQSIAETMPKLEEISVRSWTSYCWFGRAGEHSGMLERITQVMLDARRGVKVDRIGPKDLIDHGHDPVEGMYWPRYDGRYLPRYLFLIPHLIVHIWRALGRALFPWGRGPLWDVLRHLQAIQAHDKGAGGR